MKMRGGFLTKEENSTSGHTTMQSAKDSQRTSNYLVSSISSGSDGANPQGSVSGHVTNTVQPSYWSNPGQAFNVEGRDNRSSQSGSLLSRGSHYLNWSDDGMLGANSAGDIYNTIPMPQSHMHNVRPGMVSQPSYIQVPDGSVPNQPPMHTGGIFGNNGSTCSSPSTRTNSSWVPPFSGTFGSNGASGSKNDQSAESEHGAGDIYNTIPMPQSLMHNVRPGMVSQPSYNILVPGATKHVTDIRNHTLMGGQVRPEMVPLRSEGTEQQQSYHGSGQSTINYFSTYSSPSGRIFGNNGSTCSSPSTRTNSSWVPPFSGTFGSKGASGHTTMQSAKDSQRTSNYLVSSISTGSDGANPQGSVSGRVTNTVQPSYWSNPGQAFNVEGRDNRSSQSGSLLSRGSHYLNWSDDGMLGANSAGDIYNTIPMPQSHMHNVRPGMVSQPSYNIQVPDGSVPNQPPMHTGGIFGNNGSTCSSPSTRTNSSWVPPFSGTFGSNGASGPAEPQKVLRKFILGNCIYCSSTVTRAEKFMLLWCKHPYHKRCYDKAGHGQRIVAEQDCPTCKHNMLPPPKKRLRSCPVQMIEVYGPLTKEASAVREKLQKK